MLLALIERCILGLAEQMKGSLLNVRLASFKADQRPYRSSAANHVGAAVLFWPTWPVAADWTLLIDEISLNCPFEIRGIFQSGAI